MGKSQQQEHLLNQINKRMKYTSEHLDMITEKAISNLNSSDQKKLALLLNEENLIDSQEEELQLLLQKGLESLPPDLRAEYDDLIDEISSPFIGGDRD